MTIQEYKECLKNRIEKCDYYIKANVEDKYYANANDWQVRKKTYEMCLYLADEVAK